MEMMPIGARHSEPSPVPIATGSMPKMVDTAVISTGRMRVGPASSTASYSEWPRARRVLV